MRASNSIDPSILIVDDNPVNQALCLRMLERLGCRTATASSGFAALGMLETQSFDIVLMDCEMPGMDGFEATRRIRQAKLGCISGTRDDTRHLPIIAITGYTVGEIGEKHLSAGMDDALSKPFGKAELAEVLNRWLPHYSAAPDAAPKAAASNNVRGTRRSTEGPVDCKALERTSVFEGERGTRFLKSLATNFSATSSRIIPDLQRALDARKTEDMGRLAHGLKSSAGALGLIRVATCCQEIETLARCAQYAAIEMTLGRLEEELSGAIDALGRLIADRENSYA